MLKAHTHTHTYVRTYSLYMRGNNVFPVFFLFFYFPHNWLHEWSKKTTLPAHDDEEQKRNNNLSKLKIQLIEYQAKP